MSYSSKESQQPKVHESQLNPLMQEALDEKIERYRSRILQKCMDEAIEEAIHIVDSLVAVEFKWQANDTIHAPFRPQRPTLPEKIELDDTTKIKPIIKH